MSATDAFFAFDGGQRMGASAVFAFSMLSTLALALVTVRVAYVVSVAYATGAAIENVGREGYFLLKTQLGQFAGCLLLANLFTSISGLAEIEWVALNGVQHGSTCNSQGVFSQIGEFATAYFIVVMGIHTFVTLVLRTHHASWFVLSSIAVGWIAAVVIAPVSVSSSTLGPLYAFIRIDCGISSAYPVAHVLLYFVPLFVSCFTSVIVYCFIFLVLRGNITVAGGLRFHMVARGETWRERDSAVERYKRFVRAVARSMIWFPVAFMLCIIPNAICQLLETSGYKTAEGGQAFTLVLRHLNGVLDVLIFYNVLRVLGPALESGAMMQPEKALSAKEEAQPGSASGTGYGRSFFDGEAQGQRAFAPIPSPKARKPWQTHKYQGSDGAMANSRTELLSANVTKAMISKPVPMSADVQAASGPTTAASVKPEDAEPLSEFLRGNAAKPAMARKAMHKPLPLLPEIRKSIASFGHRFSFYHPHAGAPAAKRAAVPPPPVPTQPVPGPSRSVSPPPQPEASPVPSVQSDMSALRDGEHGIVVMPLSAASRRHTRPAPGDRATAVISLYMAHRHSAHESGLPDFPTTASEWLGDLKTPRTAAEPRERDLIHAAPPPRSLRSRSPSPQPAPGPAARRAPPPRRNTSLDGAPATAAVTEFELGDYLASPPPPVPALPGTLAPAADAPRSPAPPSPAQSEMDMADYYTEEGHDEVPGLPPLPAFRPRLTMYDDELSVYSSMTSTFGLGARPRESPGAVRALPLPPHMRLDVQMLSPVRLSPGFGVSVKTPTPQPARGFRPIA